MKSFRLYRMYMIISMAIKFFLQMYLLQRKWTSGELDDAPAQWERLLSRQAAELKKTALKLEGLLIKVGQFLSSRADVMPQVFIQPLKELVDRVPPAPWEEVKRVMRREWNVPPEQVFSDISQTAVASASIADVYKATLKNGATVAVKIRRPRIERIFEADFAALRIVIRLMKRWTNWAQWLDIDAFFQDFVDTTRKELDFRHELANAKRFAAMLSKHKLQHVKTPHYYEQWTTESILVMEWVDGVQVSDSEWLERHKLDRGQLIGTLIDLYFVQVFEEGFFHADPHPGNLLIGADGTLHVIDFGMTGTIRPTAKRDFKTFIIGFIEQNPLQMANAFSGLGFLRTGSELLDLQKLIETGMDFFLNKDFSRVDEQNMVEVLQFLREYVASNPVQMPAEFAFLGRTVSILSGVLAQIEPKLDYLQAVRPAVAKWLTDKKVQDDPPTETADSESLLSLKGMQSLLTQGWQFASSRVTPVLQELSALPRSYNRYMETKALSEYYARQQLYLMILSCVLMLCATVLYLFDQQLGALLPGGGALTVFALYWKWQSEWLKVIKKSQQIKESE